MKAKVLKVLATLKFEVLAYTVEDMGCSTLGELADKLAKAYIPEDVDRIADDLEYAFENK